MGMVASQRIFFWAGSYFRSDGEKRISGHCFRQGLDFGKPKFEASICCWHFMYFAIKTLLARIFHPPFVRADTVTKPLERSTWIWFGKMFVVVESLSTSCIIWATVGIQLSQVLQPSAKLILAATMHARTTANFCMSTLISKDCVLGRLLCVWAQSWRVERKC